MLDAVGYSINKNNIGNLKGNNEKLAFSGNKYRKINAEADYFSYSVPKQKKTNTDSKTLFVIGGIATIALGILLALKLKTRDYLSKAQKTFREVYLRDDISKEETAKILKRFKELEKIKNDDEYKKAVFEEVKKNYGFANFPITMGDDKTGALQKSIGGCDNINCSILLSNNLKRQNCINTIHHEFRHAKQNYIAFHYNPEKYIKALNNLTAEMLSNPSYKGLDIEEGIKWISEYMGKPNKSNVPKKYETLAEKVLKSKSHYVDPEKNYTEYRYSFKEKDAYTAGDKIENVIKNIPDEIAKEL